MRWTWIDRFTSFESGRAATAVKCLSLAEDHFADHFPGFPVMPAPLILEGLAQTGGILVGEVNRFTKNVVLAKMSATFHREATPGEQLTYSVRLENIGESGARVAGKAHSGADLVAEAEIMFGHAPADLLPGGDAKFVFTGEMARLIRTAEAAAAPPGA
ncbi:MAG: beta-hydroxyacyl-ACP dehydratase [Gemmataceae bacterium]|nr:beta-hydroxyacyl-ACP dehydratase [Gemmataceae bacterium]